MTYGLEIEQRECISKYFYINSEDKENLIKAQKGEIQEVPSPVILWT